MSSNEFLNVILPIVVCVLFIFSKMLCVLLYFKSFLVLLLSLFSLFAFLILSSLVLKNSNSLKVCSVFGFSDGSIFSTRIVLVISSNFLLSFKAISVIVNSLSGLSKSLLLLLFYYRYYHFDHFYLKNY